MPKNAVPKRNYTSVILDLGNSGLKAMIEETPKSKQMLTHAVRFITEAQFEQFSKRESGAMRGKNGALFRYSRKGLAPLFVMVGDIAEMGAFERKTGGAKYAPDYYPILMCALLLKLFPAGLDNLQVMNAFPPSDFRFREDMMLALGGKHDVMTPDGKTVTYRVKSVKTYDEPIGGLCCYVLAPDGIHYSKTDIATNHRVLTIDIGGKISSLAVASLNNGVDYTQTESLDLGIQDVMNTLSTLMLSNPNLNKYFSAHRGGIPHDDKLRSALVKGVYEAGGYELNVLNEIADSTALIRQRIKDAYQLKFGGLSRFDHIIVTGGGGALLFEQLREHVLDFNPARVYLSHDVESDMHFANMFGGDKILSALIAEGA